MMCPNWAPLVGKNLEFYRKIQMADFINAMETLVAFLCMGADVPFPIVELHIHRVHAFRDIPEIYDDVISALSMSFTRGPVDQDS